MHEQVWICHYYISHAHTHTHTFSLFYSLSFSLFLSLSLSFSPSVFHSHSLTLSLSFILSHSFVYIYILISFTHTHSLSLRYLSTLIQWFKKSFGVEPSSVLFLAYNLAPCILSTCPSSHRQLRCFVYTTAKKACLFILQHTHFIDIQGGSFPSSPHLQTVPLPVSDQAWLRAVVIVLCAV